MEHNDSQLTQSSLSGLCPSTNFLKLHDVLETGSISLFRERRI